MIKTQNLIPEIYYKESRDFQLFGRIYDIIFNYVKTNVDLMENFPINNHTDSRLIELLARTLGFQNQQNYRNDDLNAICNVFIKLIRKKGSKESIEILLHTILNTAGIKEKGRVDIVGNEVLILIPDAISNPEIKLFEEVLEYILPVGVTYQIITASIRYIDKVQLKVIQNAFEGTLIDNDKNLSNISIARTDERMKTTKEQLINNPVDIKNPLSGDLRYSVIAGRRKGE